MSRTDPETTGLEHMLCFDLYAANHAFGRMYKPLLEPLGLTYPQYLVMVTLWAAAPLSVGDIGQRLALESNTLTPLLKRLEAMGLVQRTRDSADERRVSVDLTDTGRAREAQAAHVPGCAAEATGLSLDELQALHQQLRKLRSGLKRV
ncbi:MarR family winged helix-turn-helix transcriptional regulator [Puniceibacterium sediminis]|uniref:DNA-binding transcriptional regulator, MarR family n=1 Tax=Puniceibacterium sediminis TaxID=1608407 RepID=A0A238WSK3_9RHOB|nr:MarR family transcriptional regulator [Puniceibacterium sediminis]SNR49540.1 DNA-binding transcriptional regulator, MarR family [Puniceibacterium sediminis]